MAHSVFPRENISAVVRWMEQWLLSPTGRLGDKTADAKILTRLTELLQTQKGQWSLVLMS